MKTRPRLVTLAAALCATVTLAGCGQDLVIGGELVPTAAPSPTTTPGCILAGSECTLSSDCCSNSCVLSGDGITDVCQ